MMDDETFKIGYVYKNKREHEVLLVRDFKQEWFSYAYCGIVVQGEPIGMHSYSFDGRHFYGRHFSGTVQDSRENDLLLETGKKWIPEEDCGEGK